MLVDFHVHSTSSDGTCSPSELVACASKQGISVLALTDHDNCDGAADLLRAGAEIEQSNNLNNPNNRTILIPGIELSIEPGAGFDKFHLLGLGIDPENEGLKTFLRRILDGRNGRNERIIANFRRLGIEMTDPSVTPIDQSNNLNNPNNRTIFSYAHGEVLARPHFARWLMERGYVRSIAEAFERYLLPESPRETRCYEERWHPSQEDAFATVHGAGGLCVMAHPKYWRSDWKSSGCDFAAAERGLAALKEKGLDGVEALYQANTGEENVEFTRIATKFGYLKSAGSDFHGANKPHIPLGMDVSEAFIGPLLDALGVGPGADTDFARVSHSKGEL